MTQEEREEVQSTIDNEGFDYSFDGYSDFEEVDDKKFHKLRLAYIKAKQSLENYINQDTDD